MFTAVSGLLFAAAAGAQGLNPHVRRDVKGNTVFSEGGPGVEVRIPKGFRFIGKHEINLYGNSEAEQFVFVKQDRNHVLESFYLVQFEHFLPSNDLTFNYDSMRQTQVGDLKLNFDVRSWSGLAGAITDEPGSDVASLGGLFAEQDLSFPQNTVLVRMVHLPDADHRTEMMIFYGEALREGSPVPVRKEGVSLDEEAPASAQMFLEHALHGLAIRSRSKMHRRSNE
jgi:hypothetical protein